MNQSIEKLKRMLYGNKKKKELKVTNNIGKSDVIKEYSRQIARQKGLKFCNIANDIVINELLLKEFGGFNIDYGGKNNGRNITR
jgi:hypothetical protein